MKWKWWKKERAERLELQRGILTGPDKRAVEEAQARLDRTREDDELVAGLVRAAKKKQHDYLSGEMARTFRRANG